MGWTPWISDEARDRNDSALFTGEVRRMTNTMVRKINAVAAATLAADTAASGQAFAGHPWSTVILSGVSPTPPQQAPLGDAAAAGLRADVQELGVSYSLLLLSPAQEAQLDLLYGADGDAALAAFGITEVYSSNRIPAGTGYFVDTSQAGQDAHREASRHGDVP